MRDALAVRGVQSFQYLARVLDGLPDRHRAFERRAFDELHHQVIGADIVKLADVRMVQRRYHSGFLFEARGELLLRHFDRDRAAQPRVARLLHFAHAARADGVEEFVGADAFARCHGAGAPFFNSAGQLTITVSGCAA